MSGAASSPMGGPATSPVPNLSEFLWHVHGNLAEQIKFADPEKISDIAKGRNNMSLRGNRISDL